MKKQFCSHIMYSTVHNPPKKGNNSQVCQHSEILDVPCEVELYECACVRERLMPCPTEECHTGVAEQGGQQADVGHGAQAADAAVIATCRWVIYQHTNCTCSTHNTHTHLYTHTHTHTELPIDMCTHTQLLNHTDDL